MDIKYRSRLQITVEILEVAANGANKTRIMYGASMSFAQMNEYLPYLTGKGLLEYREESKVYRTTPKGLEALRHYQKLNL